MDSFSSTFIGWAAAKEQDASSDAWQANATLLYKLVASLRYPPVHLGKDLGTRWQAAVLQWDWRDPRKKSVMKEAVGQVGKWLQLRWLGSWRDRRNAWRRRREGWLQLPWHLQKAVVSQRSVRRQEKDSKEEKWRAPGGSQKNGMEDPSVSFFKPKKKSFPGGELVRSDLEETAGSRSLSKGRKLSPRRTS